MSRFEKGRSGNPLGRPRGIVDKRTELSKLLVPHANELINKAVELALAGDVCALRLCLERLIPKASGETLNFSLSRSDVESMEAVLNSNGAIIEAIANGELTLDQAHAVSGLLKNQAEFIVAGDLAKRAKAIIEQLEKIKNGHKL